MTRKRLKLVGSADSTTGTEDSIDKLVNNVELLVEKKPFLPVNNGANNVFIMNPKTAEAVTSGVWYADTETGSSYPYAKVDNSGTSYGIWIERKYRAGTSNTPESYDFDVKACWYGAGIVV